jgi:hypothetical protein
LDLLKNGVYGRSIDFQWADGRHKMWGVRVFLSKLKRKGKKMGAAGRE